MIFHKFYWNKHIIVGEKNIFILNCNTVFIKFSKNNLFKNIKIHSILFKFNYKIK
jgi:hypothetical protein